MTLRKVPRTARLASCVLTAALALGACGGSTSGDTSSGSPATPSATSSAEAVEDAFIAAIGGSLGNHSRSGLIILGERACGAFADGSSAADIRDIFVRKGLTDAQASRVILAAVVSFCPQFKEKANP